jgi:hypothetical protein
MRFILGLVAVLAVLYGGYWFVGSRAVERGAESAFLQMNAQGWEASHDGISTIGFPSRFDTTVTAPRLLDPATGIGWEAPWLQVFALSYLPTEIIALLPDEQAVILPGDRIDIRSDGMRASGRVGFSTALPFDNLTVESGPLTLAAQSGWQAGLARALFALRRADGVPADYDVWFEATGITLPASTIPGLPETMPVLRVDGTMTLDQPIDRMTTPDARLQNVTLRQLLLDFGTTAITAEGTLALDPAGIPEGTVNLTIRDWRAALAIGVAAGIVPQGFTGLAERAGAVLAGGGTDLTAPLTFTAGQMRLGPVPLGPAPSLYPQPQG